MRWQLMETATSKKARLSRENTIEEKRKMRCKRKKRMRTRKCYKEKADELKVKTMELTQQICEEQAQCLEFKNKAFHYRQMSRTYWE